MIDKAQEKLIFARMDSTCRLILALVILVMVQATAEGANLYANALTDQTSIDADFDDYSYLDPGIGTFDASPDYGLQVLSEAPNSYHGIKIRKAVAPKTSDLQAQVFSHVSSSIDPMQSQTNPNYAAGIYLFKYVTNPDGSPNLVEAQKNFVKIELVRNVDFEGIQQYLHYRFDSDGIVIFDDYIPLGALENLTLRVNYSAMDGRISVAYADGSGGFKTCPVIFAGWDSATTDGLLVGLLATTIPYTSPGQPKPPVTYSVRPGEVYLRNLEISSGPTARTGDYLLSLESSTNNLSSWTPVPIFAEMLNNEGKVMVPGSASNSFFRMRIYAESP